MRLIWMEPNTSSIIQNYLQSSDDTVVCQDLKQQIISVRVSKKKIQYP